MLHGNNACPYLSGNCRAGSNRYNPLFSLSIVVRRILETYRHESCSNYDPRNRGWKVHAIRGGTEARLCGLFDTNPSGPLVDLISD